MDIRRARLELGRPRVSVFLADRLGEREVELEGAAAARIAAAAAPLIAELGGGDEDLVVDWLADEARAGDAVLRGDAFRGLAVATALARALVDEILVRPPGFVGGDRDVELWSRLYQVGGDGWELGRAAPPLVRWAETHGRPGRRTIVPGCGRGHEARAFAERGDRVTGVDFSPEAIALARAQPTSAEHPIDWRLGDVFALPAGGERWELVVEHTCFCAIPVARRDEWIDAMADVLVDGGLLVGLFWDHGRAGGPPFSVSRHDLERQLGRRFELEEVQVAPDSVATRRGEELLVVARRAAND